MQPRETINKLNSNIFSPFFFYFCKVAVHVLKMCRFWNCDIVSTKIYNKRDDFDFEKTYLKMRGVGPDVVSLVRPTGVQLFDFFCSDIQLYVLLSPYLCLISFLYLGLYVLGDASISLVSSIPNKHLCVLIHIRIKVEVGTVKHV